MHQRDLTVAGYCGAAEGRAESQKSQQDRVGRTHMDLGVRQN